MRLTLSRRRFLTALVCGGAAVIATACGQAPPTTTPAPAKPAEAPTPPAAAPATPTAPPKPAEQPAQKPAAAPTTAAPTAAPPPASKAAVDLKMGGWYGKDTQKVAERQIELFKEKFPNANVSIVVMEFQVEKNVVMMASGAAPDVFWINNDHAAPWASRNAVRAVDDHARRDNVDFKDLYDIGRVLYTYKDKLYAFPDSLAPLHTLYNPKLFEAAGVPVPPANYKDPSWTTEALVDRALKLTKRPTTGPAEQYGYFMGTSIYSILPILWMFAGGIVDDDLNPTKVAFDRPGTRQAVQWTAELRLKHKVTSSTAETQGIPAASQFSTGRLAMLQAGPWNWPTFMDPAVRAKVPWEIAPLQRGPGGQLTDMAGNGYGMSTQTKNPDMAWELLKFNTLGDGQRINWEPTTSNGIPGRKSFAEDPKFGHWLSAQSKRAIIDCMEYSHFKPKHPNWAEMVTALDSSLDRVWTGAIPVEEAVQTAQGKISEAFARKT
jgi:multiple sugar transport system substrate-binding protein